MIQTCARMQDSSEAQQASSLLLPKDEARLMRRSLQGSATHIATPTLSSAAASVAASELPATVRRPANDAQQSTQGAATACDGSAAIAQNFDMAHCTQDAEGRTQNASDPTQIRTAQAQSAIRLTEDRAGRTQNANSSTPDGAAKTQCGRSPATNEASEPNVTSSLIGSVTAEQQTSTSLTQIDKARTQDTISLNNDGMYQTSLNGLASAQNGTAQTQLIASEQSPASSSQTQSAVAPTYEGTSKALRTSEAVQHAQTDSLKVLQRRVVAKKRKRQSSSFAGIPEERENAVDSSDNVEMAIIEPQTYSSTVGVGDGHAKKKRVQHKSSQVAGQWKITFCF